MRKIFFVSMVLITVLFMGCEDIFNSKISVQTTLSDSRFNGEFWYDGTGTSFSRWKFNGTNKATWSVNTYQYIYDISIFEMEIKLENNHLWSRLWDNEYSDWRDEGSYSFRNNGDLVIDGVLYEKR